jgi:hypothetical protein
MLASGRHVAMSSSTHNYSDNVVRHLSCTATAESVAACGIIKYIPRSAALVWRGQARDWRRVKVEWQGELYLISRSAWEGACPSEPVRQRGFNSFVR